LNTDQIQEEEKIINPLEIFEEPMISTTIHPKNMKRIFGKRKKEKALKNPQP